MKLLSVGRARSIWWGHLVDLNPRGIKLFPMVVPSLLENYKFLQYPSLEDIPKLTEGLKFQQGEFVNSEGLPVGVDFTIYAEGFVADTRSSTDISDAFLKDVLTRFNEIFRLVDYEEVIRQKKYFSEVYIYAENTLELINPKLKLISKYLSSNAGDDNVIEVGRLSFCTDPDDKLNIAPFSFERANDIPFAENRYYSSAPLETHKHLELLDMLEKILTKK